MTSNHIEQLPYNADSSKLMLKLLTLPNPVFLDSCSTGTLGGRYDILSAMPVATLQATAAGLRCSESLPDAVQDNIFAAADHLLRCFGDASMLPDPTQPADWLFAGGLLGFLGYPALAGQGQLLLEQAYLGVYPWAVTVDHQRRQSWLTFHHSCPISTRAIVVEALQAASYNSIEFNLLEDFSNNMSKSDYQQAFARIKDYIDAGDCYQVNLTQQFSTRFEGHPFGAYRRLRQATGKPFSAFLSWDGGALLSLSPERFISLDGDQVMTQPIKGTRPRSPDPEEDRRLAAELVSSEKDRAENLMIVDLLRNDLGTVCAYGSIHTPRLFELQEFDNVFHLVSTVKGRLRNGVTGLQLLERCFPGGSVTGAPKLRAMEIIRELEPHKRGPYCGTVLYQDFSGRMDSNITIRTLLCVEESLFCWAGGGIVADSRCDQEYRECFDKIYSLINTLQE